MARKKVKKTTFKIWTVIEKHIEYVDGTDEFVDLKDEETRSLGEFGKLQNARVQVDFLGETHMNDGDID